MGSAIRRPLGRRRPPPEVVRTPSTGGRNAVGDPHEVQNWFSSGTSAAHLRHGRVELIHRAFLSEPGIATGLHFGCICRG